MPSNSSSLDHIKLLMDALNCGAAMIDRAGTIVWANARLCAMAKLSSAQLIGKSVESFYDAEEDRQRLRGMVERFDEDREDEFYLPLPDGERLPIVYSSKRVPGDAPLGDHRVITMIDVTRQKDAESAMREQYKFIVEMSDTVLQQAIELKHHSEKLEERVRQRTAELHAAHMHAIYMLAVAAEAKDLDTGKHVRRIEHYSRLLAQELGISGAESESIGYSAILHDIGKIHVPDRILSKPGPLDDDERREMELHTIVGERILSGAAFFDRARRIARSHHENWDGSGYPDRSAAEAIPVEARIVHVADVFDALTTDRVYKESWSPEQAAATIVAQSGGMFDPRVVKAFESLLKSGRFKTNGDPR